MNASIDAVRVAGTPQGPIPVVLLAVEDEEDVLPIFIGFSEAESIAAGGEGGRASWGPSPPATSAGRSRTTCCST
jgi:bifunctional DNase/RNase